MMGFHSIRRTGGSERRSGGERAQFRGTGRGRHRCRTRHRPGLRHPARPPGRRRRGQRPGRVAWTGSVRTRAWPPTVAAEIVGAGGAAIADASDVSTPEGGRSLIEAAVERFGRLDILVNNAGIIRWAGLPEADTENLARHLAVHVLGIVQHDPGGLAPHGRPGLRPHRHDHVVGSVRAAEESLLRHRQGWGDRAHPQPHHRRRPSRHQGQPHRAGAPSPGWPARPRRRVQPAGRPLRGCRPTSWLRWSASSPTSPARSAARSTPPASGGSPGSSSPRRRGMSTPRPSRPSRTWPEHWADHQRRDGVLRPRRPHGLVGRLHGPSPPERRRSHCPLAGRPPADRSARSRRGPLAQRAGTGPGRALSRLRPGGDRPSGPEGLGGRPLSDRPAP